jgi:twitching motility protein PilT
MPARRSTAAIDGWIEELWERRGTDLLLTMGAPPLLRVGGSLTPVEGAAPLEEDEVAAIVQSVVGSELIDRYRDEREVDFSFNWRSVARFRANAFYQRQSCALALRLFPFGIPSIEDLGLPPVVADLLNKPNGLILVTGPTGSGKSTSLASMIDHINDRRACHILTIEDPIEYLHHHKRSAINQREVGDDSSSFQRALRSALREDPDVLLVGEMRDLESIATTLTIAETGHLVLATLHTNDAAQAIDRIIDVFPADRRTQIQVQLASTLLGVVYQRLIPRLSGDGLVAAFEILVANNAVKNLIREGKTRQVRNVIATHQSEGMQTLEMSLNRLVTASLIAHETAINASLYPKELAPAPPRLTSVPPTAASAGR